MRDILIKINEINEINEKLKDLDIVDKISFIKEFLRFKIAYNYYVTGLVLDEIKLIFKASAESSGYLLNLFKTNETNETDKTDEIDEIYEYFKDVFDNPLSNQDVKEQRDEFNEVGNKILQIIDGIARGESYCTDVGNISDPYINRLKAYLGYEEYYNPKIFKDTYSADDNKFIYLIREYYPWNESYRTELASKLEKFIPFFCNNYGDYLSGSVDIKFNELFGPKRGGSKNKSKRSMRKSRKSRKQVRKSRKSRKQVHKSRKLVRKSRKSRKQVRRNPNKFKINILYKFYKSI